MGAYSDNLYHKVIPVFCHDDLEVAKQVVVACYEGGMRTFEWMNRCDNALAIFEQLVPWAKNEIPDMAFWAGSVLSAAQTQAFIQAGAQTIVSPIISEQVQDSCQKARIPYIPGCATPTEIFHAAQHNEIVKVFPGKVLGPEFVKSVLASMHGLRLMVTGGIGVDDLGEWWRAGVWCIGVGSRLIDDELLRTANWKELTCRCRQLT